MTFSDLELAVSQSSRKHGYVRDNVRVLWTPGAGDTQSFYSRELAGAMLLESDKFFDRALALYLLRSRLREMQASTWAGVATYYSNYFLAHSFIRFHMKSVTHLSNGSIFEVTRTDAQAPVFTIRRRKEREKHGDVWRSYYDAVTQMGWPDSVTVTEMAPTINSLRFREQHYRERINYRPGEGFEEIYMTRPRYLSAMKGDLMDNGDASLLLSDAAFTDRMAARRLTHMATLLHRLSDSRVDVDVEASVWQSRAEIVTRYARGHADTRFARSLVSKGT